MIAISVTATNKMLMLLSFISLTTSRSDFAEMILFRIYGVTGQLR
jgi:hypothetical protein